MATFWKNLHQKAPPSPGRFQTAKSAKDLGRRDWVVSRERETTGRRAGRKKGASVRLLTTLWAKLPWARGSSLGQEGWSPGSRGWSKFDQQARPFMFWRVGLHMADVIDGHWLRKAAMDHQRAALA